MPRGGWVKPQRHQGLANRVTLDVLFRRFPPALVEDGGQGPRGYVPGAVWIGRPGRRVWANLGVGWRGSCSVEPAGELDGAGRAERPVVRRGALRLTAPLPGQRVPELRRDERPRRDVPSTTSLGQREDLALPVGSARTGAPRAGPRYTWGPTFGHRWAPGTSGVRSLAVGRWSNGP